MQKLFRVCGFLLFRAAMLALLGVLLLVHPCSAVLPVYTFSGAPQSSSHFVYSETGGRRLVLSWSDSSNLVFLRPVRNLSALCADEEGQQQGRGSTGSAFVLEVQDWAAPGVPYPTRRAQADYLSKREVLARVCPSISNRLVNFTCTPVALYKAKSSAEGAVRANALILSGTEDAWYPVALQMPTRGEDGRVAQPAQPQTWWLSVSDVAYGHADSSWFYVGPSGELRQISADAASTVLSASEPRATASDGATWRVVRRAEVCDN
jgi:hypothetical protein